MDVENLVKMANDIGNYFSSDPDRASGVAGMVNHIKRFWEPRMRKQIGAHLDAGGEGLSEIARAAITELEGQRSAA